MVWVALAQVATGEGISVPSRDKLSYQGKQDFIWSGGSGVTDLRYQPVVRRCPALSSSP